MLKTVEKVDGGGGGTTSYREIVSRPFNQPPAATTAEQSNAVVQKTMMDQMDKRRVQWEKEVERMAEDFFQVKLPKADSETTQRTITTSSQTTAGKQLCLPSISSTNEDDNIRNNDLTADIMSSNRFHDDKPEYYRDGSMTWCRQRFDVRGYDPADISVRVEANRKLIVCARHVESADETGSRFDAVTRQMSKTVDVPRGVRPHCITSYFAGDGFLTVVAPVDDDFDVDTSSDRKNSADSSSGQSLPRDCEFRPIQRKSSAIMQTAPSTALELEADDDVINSACRNVVRTDDGDLMLKILTDLGSFDYRPNDILVHFHPHVIKVRARRQLTASVGDDGPPTAADTNGTISVRGGGQQPVKHHGPVEHVEREFSRDFDIPGPVHKGTARTSLGTDGRLWIGSSMESNDPSRHRSVAGYVAQWIPLHGRPCRIEFVD